MIIIGIDPGSRITGYGLIKNHRDRLEYIHSGFIKVEGERFPQKLGFIFEQLSEVIQLYAPDHMSIQSVFMHKNADSALKLGQARGAAICAGHHAGMEVSEYAAREVKLAIVGQGAAQKEQVKHMVCRLLSLRQELQADESDALAIALCHAQHSAMEHKTGIPARAFNRKRAYRR